MKPLNDLGISGGESDPPESPPEVFVELGIPVSEVGEVDFDVFLSWVESVLLGSCEDACVVVAVAASSAVCWFFLPRNHRACKAGAVFLPWLLGCSLATAAVGWLTTVGWLSTVTVLGLPAISRLCVGLLSVVAGLGLLLSVARPLVVARSCLLFSW